MDPKDEATFNALKALTAKCVRLEARIDALTAMALLLAKRQQMSDADFHSVMKNLDAHALQERLLKVEDKNPGFAAEMDHRPEPGNSP